MSFGSGLPTETVQIKRFEHHSAMICLPKDFQIKDLSLIRQCCNGLPTETIPNEKIASFAHGLHTKTVCIPNFAKRNEGGNPLKSIASHVQDRPAIVTGKCSWLRNNLYSIRDRVPP